MKQMHWPWRCLRMTARYESVIGIAEVSLQLTAWWLCTKSFLLQHGQVQQLPGPLLPSAMGIKVTHQHLGPLLGPAAHPDLLAEDALRAKVVPVSEARESQVGLQDLLGKERGAFCDLLLESATYPEWWELFPSWAGREELLHSAGLDKQRDWWQTQSLAPLMALTSKILGSWHYLNRYAINPCQQQSAVWLHTGVCKPGRGTQQVWGGLAPAEGCQFPKISVNIQR